MTPPRPPHPAQCVLAASQPDQACGRFPRAFKSVPTTGRQGTLSLSTCANRPGLLSLPPWNRPLRLPPGLRGPGRQAPLSVEGWLKLQENSEATLLPLFMYPGPFSEETRRRWPPKVKHVKLSSKYKKVPVCKMVVFCGVFFFLLSLHQEKHDFFFLNLRLKCVSSTGRRQWPPGRSSPPPPAPAHHICTLPEACSTPTGNVAA